MLEEGLVVAEDVVAQKGTPKGKSHCSKLIAIDFARVLSRARRRPLITHHVLEVLLETNYMRIVRALG